LTQLDTHIFSLGIILNHPYDTMAANQNDIPVLPNVTRLSQGITAAAQEFEKFQNMPAFDANNRISRAIEQLTQVVAENTQALKSLQAEVTGIKTEITGIKTEITGIKTEITGIKTQISVTLVCLSMSCYS
jgi:septal ring factor EnvC (AmiA/AmiB activator)